MSKFWELYKRIINKVSPYLIIGYFVLTYLPYFVGRFPLLLNFFASYDIYYRGFLSIIFIGVTLSHYFINKEKKISPLIVFILITAYFVAGALCVPSRITVRHILPNSNAVVDASLQVGFKDLFSGLLNSFFDLYFCFYLMVFGANVIQKKIIKVILIFTFVVSVLEACSTFVFDKDSYLSLFNLKFDNVYDLNISGTFQSKNGLGFLLFQGVLSTFVLFKYCKKIWQHGLLIIGLSIIMGVSLLSFCKTSAIISVFCCFAYAIFSIFKNQAHVRRILFISIFLFATLAICLILFIPQLGSIKGIGGVIPSIKNTVLERLQIWYESTFLMKAPQLFIGYSKGVSNYLLRLVDDNLSSYYFHNGFVTIMVNYGLIGLILYVWLVVYIFKTSKFLDESWKNVYTLVFCASIAYTCFEAYHLFLSGSPVVMLQSILLVYLPKLYSTKKERRVILYDTFIEEDFYSISI